MDYTLWLKKHLLLLLCEPRIDFQNSFNGKLFRKFFLFSSTHHAQLATLQHSITVKLSYIQSN